MTIAHLHVAQDYLIIEGLNYFIIAFSMENPISNS